MTGSRYSPLGGVSLTKLIVSQRFGTSAPKAENGFVPRRIVSSRPRRRNNPARKASNFNDYNGTDRLLWPGTFSALAHPSHG
jgi:hypothetical protein